MKRKIVLFSVLISMFLIISAQHYTDCKVFIWDNDRGATFINPDDSKETGYEGNFIKAFDRLGYNEKNGNIAYGTTLPSAATLANEYSAVFVICGNQPASGEILPDKEIQTLTYYLENGGALYLEGNNVTHYLEMKNRDFLNTYFNNALLDTGTEYSGYDTLVIDTASSFTHGYEIVYPAGSAPDLGIDQFKMYKSVEEPFYFNVLVYDSRQKLYKSAASAYTPPDAQKGDETDADGKAPVMFKTYFSSVDMGAYAAPHRKYEQLPDSVENQLLRTAYISDIMKWFGLARTLVVDRTAKANVSIAKSLANIGVECDVIRLDPGKPIKASTLRQYNTVIWVGGSVAAKDGTFSNADAESLKVYLDYGGNLLMYGENIAEAIGSQGADEPAGENQFLVKYLGVDYIDHTYKPEYDFVAWGTGSIYEQHESTRQISVKDVNDPDFIRYIYLSGENYSEPVYYFRSSAKAPCGAGTYNAGGTFESVFLTFMLETADPEIIDSFNYVSLVDYFTYDLIYHPTGALKKQAIAVTYEKSERGIWFTVDIQNPENGSLILVSQNETVEEPVYEGNPKYVLFTESNTGTFILRYTTAEGISFEKQLRIEDALRTDFAYTTGAVLNIQLLNPNSSTVKLYDITGKHISDIPVSGNDFEWHGFSEVPSGVYFVKINSDVKNTVCKVLRY